MSKNEETRNKPAEAATATATPTPAATAVTVVQGTGFRKVRGKERSVNLPHYRVMIGDDLAAITSTEKNKPICAVAEILEEEIDPILAAVKKTRGDDAEVLFKKQHKRPEPKA